MVMLTASRLHQQILNFLIAQFHSHFATHHLPFMVTGFIGVSTEKSAQRLPDVMVCSVELWKRVCTTEGMGVLDGEEKPMIVVEVTSDNWREDYIRKRAEYAMANIPEYWIVDPNKSKIQVCFNPNNDNGYEDLEFLPGEDLHSVQFPELILSVNQVLSPPVVEDLIREEQAERKQLEQRAEAERQR
ncbi:MAG: Uma2 family endonuclease, partial [Chroococcales cyanobacterium]